MEFFYSSIFNFLMTGIRILKDTESNKINFIDVIGASVFKIYDRLGWPFSVRLGKTKLG